MPFLGETAALTAAALWAFGSLLFTIAARRAGSFPLNLVRITLALGALSSWLALTRGTHWAPEATRHDLVLLVLSGWAGLTLGDWCYFASLARLGPRLGTVLMTLSPPLAALLAYPLMGEALDLRGLVGMAVTLGGVSWVVLERPAEPAPRGHRLQGVILGMLAATGQALGLVLSKMGMGDRVDPLAASAIRMAAATVGVWALGIVSGKVRAVPWLLRDRTARRATVGAAFLGPVFGVWLSLVAVQHAPTGIAATLMSTVPVMILPLVVFFHHERISHRAVLGALVAVAGVALLFTR
jgi:drug/metabolite transporter (DMT)-like permease